MISALQVEDLRVERGGRQLFPAQSFHVEAGEALAVTGPNGAGKTSLLRCLAGLLRPAGGAVRLVGLETGGSPGSAVHWLGAHDGLKGQRTVEAELRFWTAWTGGERAAEAEQRTLAAVGLQRERRLEVRRLSSGQRRRLAIARLLAAPRPVWLLDEPLAPLDAAWRERTGDLMRRHLEGGGMVIAAVHDPLPVPARTLALAP